MSHVFLAVPHYGQLVTGALESLIKASTRHRIHLQTAGGSLLAYVFNSLWCHSLNMRAACGLADGGITHFAMHHSDIQAQPEWLDILMDEMEHTSADIISTIVPIKDHRGLTSTGFMDNDGHIKRLTMAEAHALPETFSSFALPAPDRSRLMVNTGLMLVDLRKPWVEEFHFHIEDNIVRTREGHFVPSVLPEDWAMSRWAHERDLHVFATRKVKAHHWGPASFPNDKPWGDCTTDPGDTF